MKKQFLVVAALCLAMTGLTLKAASPALINVVNLVDEENRLISRLSTVGLRLAGARALTHQGVYRAISLYHPFCRGSLALVLLDRNGEAANILDSFDGESGFYYEGKRYKSFPYWPYVLGKLSGSDPVVIAYRESGTCELNQLLSK